MGDLFCWLLEHLRYTGRYGKNKRRGRVSGPVCHCPWSTPTGRRGRIAVPGPPWTPHPRHPFPLLLATRLSPSFPCESIVRSRGAPWLGSGTVRGWLLVGSRGLVEAVATTPEQQRRTPILRCDDGVRRSTNLYAKGAFLPSSHFSTISLVYPDTLYSARWYLFGDFSSDHGLFT